MVPMKNYPLQPQQVDALAKQAPLLRRTLSPVVREGVTLLQLDTEGLAKAKTDVTSKAWNTFNRLTGRSVRIKRCPVTANSIAHRLLESGRFQEQIKITH